MEKALQLALNMDLKKADNYVMLHIVNLGNLNSEEVKKMDNNCLFQIINPYWVVVQTL